MKKMPIVSVFLVLFLALTVGTGRSYAQVQGAVSAASALGTGFTYQGQLKNSGGSPITATCSLRFTLWDAASSGVQIGSSSTVDGVGVTNGYFTTQVNSAGEFGLSAFNGEARWLKIEVKCTGDASYIALSPLQPLTPAPYALALPGLYTQPGIDGPNVIGGYSGNTVTAGLSGATIGGGGASGSINSVTGNYGTVSGGYGNTASFMYASVGGGYGNNASNSDATVGGGESNTASGDTASVGGGMENIAGGAQASIGGGYNNVAGGDYSTVAGGRNNTASNLDSTVGGGDLNTSSGIIANVSGGYNNTASGNYATIPGGNSNVAGGIASFAAGTKAQANHNGTFVWGDSTNANFVSTAVDQFLIRAAGGVGINTNITNANSLTVNGQIIAGGTTAPSGSEPLVSEGTQSGISMDDRAGGTNPRWVIYPNNGALNFYNTSNHNVAWFTSGGVLTLPYLGSAGSVSLCLNMGAQIAQCSSSLRYKDNVAGLTMGLETIARLRPVTFDWKTSGAPDLGFVAEEVDKITPLLTTRNADGQIEGVKYDRISALLVKGMQEQQEQIQEQNKQITNLKAQNDRLDDRVKALEQGSGSSPASPFATPWPWLALVSLGGMAMFTFRRRMA
jgi:hypothetical protein